MNTGDTILPYPQGTSQGDGWKEDPSQRTAQWQWPGNNTLTIPANPWLPIPSPENSRQVDRLDVDGSTNGLGGNIQMRLIQSFDSGATRSADADKPDYEGFFSPLVLEAYAEYMQEHRTQDNGSVRASDNWQQGIPFHKYMKSLFRHVMQLWQLHRGYTPKPEKRAGKVVPVTITSAVAGVMFNSMGYFHEYLMDGKAWEHRVISEPEGADVIRATNRRQRVG